MGPRTAACAALLLALALGVATGAPLSDGVFEFPSKSAAKVLILGKTASLKVFPNKTSSAFLSLKFNRIEELDTDGEGVAGHVVSSLAGLTPTFSTGVRTSGDTDYTYVKMVFESQLRLPPCPVEERPSPRKGAKGSLAGASRLGGAKGAAAAAAAQADGDLPVIKTLGDSSLAAAIASLTSDPPPRPEAMQMRHLLADGKRGLLPKPTGEPATLVTGNTRAPVKLSYTPAGKAPEPGYPLMSAALSKDGRDPFAKLVSTPKLTSSGVSVIATAPQPPLAAPAGNAPVITLMFFFGMTANKTFAYGKGNAVHVPADGLKFNIEAANWPFCSPLNSLKFDIALGTNLGAKAQAQLTLDSLAEERTDADEMVTDMYASQLRRRRSLLQPMDFGSDTVIDAESAAALASRGRKTPKLPTKTAKLLVSPTQAAAIECATVAYPSVGAAVNSTVGVTLVTASVTAPTAASSKIANATMAAVSTAGDLGGSRLSITFPYFDTLYYDPVISFTNVDGMSLEAPEPTGNCTGVVCGRTAEKRTSGAAAASGGRAGAAALAAAAALGLALLV